MNNDISRLNMYFSLLAIALTLVVGCLKKADPNDPASGYEDTAWIEDRTGMELHMEDGDITFINHETTKEFELPYTVNAQGIITIHDADKKMFKRDVKLTPMGQNLAASFGMLSFRPKLDDDDAKIAARQQALKDADAERNADRPSSPASYRLVEGLDIKMMFASRGEMSDEEIAGAFIANYSTESDVFKKQDMLQAQLPSIKARLAELRKIKDFRLNTINTSNMVRWNPEWANDIEYTNFLGSFDMSAKAFPFSPSGSPCLQGENYGSSTMRAFGAEYTYRPWGHSGQAICQIKVADLNLARQIEEARTSTNVGIRTTIYFRITGEKDRNGRWVLDAHRMDVVLYRQHYENGDIVYTPFPGSYSLSNQ